ncbi:MAG: hypothetical protein KAT28_01420 [Candidatus Aenigmarchaeota archaeon]|nr:hypothetical protein [Candidatus Aenigmarchaeota archaeon]
MQYDIGEEKNMREISKNQFIAVFIIIGVIVAIFLIFNFTRESCGNSICEQGENCFDCPKDCKCNEDKYCSSTEKKCIKPICGDKTCERLENCSNCPVDCGACKITSFCGDNKCDADELCSTCPRDCGICQSTYICGNKVCEKEENCYDCPKDCKCGVEEYCSSTEKKCLKPTCGNGDCEPYENPGNCCLDCACYTPEEICNKATKKCELQKMILTDARAIELAIEYFENQSLEVISAEVMGVSSYNHKLVKEVGVEITGEEWNRYIGITEDEEITEFVLP